MGDLMIEAQSIDWIKFIPFAIGAGAFFLFIRSVLKLRGILSSREALLKEKALSESSELLNLSRQLAQMASLSNASGQEYLQTKARFQELLKKYENNQAETEQRSSPVQEKWCGQLS